MRNMVIAVAALAGMTGCSGLGSGGTAENPQFSSDDIAEFRAFVTKFSGEVSRPGVQVRTVFGTLSADKLEAQIHASGSQYAEGSVVYNCRREMHPKWGWTSVCSVRDEDAVRMALALHLSRQGQIYRRA